MKMAIKVLALIFLSLSLVSCERVVQLRNIDNQPISYDFPLGDVETAILKAGAENGWSMTVEKPGLIVATLVVNIRHKAIVDITFDEKAYSIDYKDSVNLLYENGNIHRNYNLWVDALDQRIKSNLIEARPK